MISNLRLLVALLALGAPPLGAQDNGDDATAVPGKYFRTLGAGVTTSDLHLRVKDKDKAISITDAFRSILYKRNGTGQLVFYKIIPGPDGKSMQVNVAQADITNAGPLALLTFSADPGNPDDYTVEVLPDDLVAFPLGSYRIVNRSSLPVKIILGSHRANVGPNQVHLVVYPPPKEGGGAVSVRVYTDLGDGTQRLLYADTWGYDDKCRTEVLISPRPGMPNFLAVGRLRDNPTTLLLKEYLPKD